MFMTLERIHEDRACSRLVELVADELASSLCGWVVVDNNGEPPYRYLHRRYGSFSLPFGDEYAMEDPRTYVSVANAQRSATRLNDKSPDVKRDIGLDGTAVVGFWIHPDYAYCALDRYQKMTGHCFEGSPRN